jgi:hypothetical protein
MTTDSPPSACASCGQPLTDTYYEVAGQVTCEDCRIVAEEDFNLAGGAGPLLRAALLGLLAGAAGFGIYYGVGRITGREYGIVAAVIGLMVGAAVKRGSQGRGGWRYQALAIFITYSAIVASYVPSFYEELAQLAEPARAPHVVAPPDRAAIPDSAAVPTDSTAAAPPQQTDDADVVATVTGGLAFIAFVYAVPFLAGLDNLIGLVIIGIALFEAWHLNRRGTLHITGPYEIGAPA